MIRLYIKRHGKHSEEAQTQFKHHNPENTTHKDP